MRRSEARRDGVRSHVVAIIQLESHFSARVARPSCAGARRQAPRGNFPLDPTLEPEIDARRSTCVADALAARGSAFRSKHTSPHSSSMPKRGLRRTRQAAEGEVEETGLAVYEHGAEAADEVADELRDGIRDMVVCELDPETAWKLRWSAAGFPTIMEVDIPASDSLFLSLEGELHRALLADESTQTAVERGDGILPAIRVKRARGA